MNFYIDESGHTGLNIFDPNQPILYYGCLSSEKDLDRDALSWMERIREKVPATRIHANDIGYPGIEKIAPDLIDMHRRYGLRFGLYRIAKPDHAIICFFDQVFDSGVNKALTWSSYSTPLRYALLLKVAFLFTDELAKLAWEARIEKDPGIATSKLISLCKKLIPRRSMLPDQRSKELIFEALQWVIQNPAEVSYQVKSRKEALQVAPNIIGFQMVMDAIARRLKSEGVGASRIVVDQQSQFNKAQRTLAQFYASVSEMKMPLNFVPGMPEIDFGDMPTVPIEFSGGDKSVGLELTDTYLWLLKRRMEGEEARGGVKQLVEQISIDAEVNEISINALGARWSRWFADLQRQEISPQQIEDGRKLRALDEERRLQALGREVPKEMARLAAAARALAIEKTPDSNPS